LFLQQCRVKQKNEAQIYTMNTSFLSMRKNKIVGPIPNAGRKASERPIVRQTVNIYADQQPISSCEIRQAIDKFNDENSLPI
jgi:hypothetical protein